MCTEKETDKNKEAMTLVTKIKTFSGIFLPILKGDAPITKEYAIKLLDELYKIIYQTRQLQKNSDEKILFYFDPEYPQELLEFIENSCENIIFDMKFVLEENDIIDDCEINSKISSLETYLHDYNQEESQ